MVPHEKSGIEMERHGDVCIARLRGRIAEREAALLEEELLAAVEDGATSVVVDLSDVPMIASAGLGALMMAHKQCRAKGGSVRLVGPQPLVRQVLEITKLTKLFQIHATLADALAAGR